MNNVKKIWSFRSKQLQNAFVVFLIAAVPLGYYLYFFVIRANFREVVPGKVYRSGQPSPAQLRKWINRYGIKTVINLRGNGEKIIEKERAAANELGVKMITIRFKSTSLPTRDSLDRLIQAIETAEQPILLHCQSGIERSGTASALAAMAIGKETYNAAKWQAYVPPGPWKRNSYDKYVHISDMFNLYERYLQGNSIDTDDWHEFKKWLTVTDAFGDMDTQYRSNYRYFPKFNKAELFYPAAKLLRGAWPQFSAELIILSALAVVMYRGLSRN
jgi:protein tyrosine phosphatase (PTP) superfamily phosphohydrolase (DUF442 family)